MNKEEMLKSVYERNKMYAEKYDSVDMLKKIINSMDIIDRKFFIEGDNIYEDEALSIGQGQTISQPTTVARMLLLSRLKQKIDVLEIGSGSGWNASLIANLVNPGKVTSTERIEKLHKSAIENFNKMKDSSKLRLNVEFLHTDTFSKLWKEKFDRIITTAGVDKRMATRLQEFGNDVLKNNGLLVYPTNEAHFSGSLELWQKNMFMRRILRDEGYSFVPLLEGVK